MTTLVSYLSSVFTPNISSKPIILAGIVALANVIPDMGALSSANLMGNYIPVEQAQELKKIMQAKEKLTTLCGLSKEETELDFSDQNLGAGDAVLSPTTSATWGR
jgi:hypothetical protein